MNKHLFKIIFSKHLAQLVVVSENTSSEGKTSGDRPLAQRGGRLKTAFNRLPMVAFSVMLALGVAVFTNPVAHAQIVADKTAPPKSTAHCV